MEKLVLMLTICWVPAADPVGPGVHLKEAWRIEKQVPLRHCLTMNQVMSGGGKAGAITVRCGEPGK